MTKIIKSIAIFFAFLCVLAVFPFSTFKADIYAPDFKVTAQNYLFVKEPISKVRDLCGTITDEIGKYNATKKSYDEIWKENEVFSKYLHLQAQVDSIRPKEEIVYVERMASSYIMNNPAFYRRNMSGNTITEHGKGADNEEICVLRLSDGKIIKSSPKNNAQWMGVKVGEKVRKVSGKRLVCPKNSNYYTYWDIIRNMSVVDYTDYFPLY